ncbi:hypothetical protein OIU77_021297 [Salix suchowensis]|uniref:CCHC-type domain-containing protein n=1 Tax=Salix suchowensis TaxID=1278906 RepID=A0ABQ9CCN0_9ROSI|nr:hypothetical protein OIU77_021297 [Salix suchowensis]
MDSLSLFYYEAEIKQSRKFRIFVDGWPVNLLEVNLLLSSSMGTGNDELLKSDLGLSDSHSQLSSNETKESKDDEESVVLNEGAVGENEGTKNGESVELNEGTKIQEGFELSEGVIRNDEVIVDSGCSALKVRNTGTEEAATNQSNLVLEKRGIGSEEVCFAVETEVDMDLVDSPVRQVNIEVVDPFIVSKKPNISSITGNVEDCFLDTQNKSLIQQEKVDDIYVSGVKRKRITYDEEQPSVHVMYNSLTRASKKKLEELLQQWSEWHAQQNSLSHDFDEMLQSGEDTYFPALRFGMEKTSAVSFWIENQTRKQQDNGMIPLHSNSVPLYDRGYALGLTSADGPINIEGGLKIVGDAARCFNCGSYNHSLKECPKPRDNAAVNNARGKYDGLKPGSLDTETRKLLGLGELDPPPWLNRMQELGYPPGYLGKCGLLYNFNKVFKDHDIKLPFVVAWIGDLVSLIDDPDDKDQPSGITIFADGDVNEEQEDGEIMETELPEPKRKMSVEFPGVNAAIPDNADQRLWEVGPASSDPCRHRSHHRLNYLSESYRQMESSRAKTV